MATVQVSIGFVKTVDVNSRSVPAWTRASTAESIVSSGANAVSTLAVTAGHASAAGGVERLLWRVVVSGSETVKCSRGASPDATTASNDMVLGNSVEYFGVDAIGDKVAIVNAS